MFATIDTQLWLVKERHEREFESAAIRHRFSQPPTSIRRAIGHQFIRIGARLAAEPPFESVLSR